MSDVYTQRAKYLLQTLQAAMGGEFKAYFYGDPGFIGKSQLPCVMVDWEGSEPLTAPTRHDKWRHQAVIKVVVDKLNDLNQPRPASGIIAVPTRAKLDAYIFGRNPDGTYLETSVLGVIRRNFTMGGSVSNNQAQVRFGVSDRPDASQSGFIITAEGHVIVNLDELIPVVDRN